MAGLEGLIGGLFNVAGQAAVLGVKGAYKVGKPLAKGAMSAAFAAAPPAAKVGLGVSTRVAAFGLKNPELTGLMVAGGLGVALARNIGAEESGMGAEDRGRLAEMYGGPSSGFGIGMGSMARDESRMAFQASTAGLTQGLHRGRHGG